MPTHSLSLRLLALFSAVIIPSCENKQALEADMKAKQQEIAKLSAKRKSLDSKLSDAYRAVNRLREQSQGAADTKPIIEKIQELESTLEAAQEEDAITTASATAAKERLENYKKAFPSS